MFQNTLLGVGCRCRFFTQSSVFAAQSRPNRSVEPKVTSNRNPRNGNLGNVLHAHKTRVLEQPEEKEPHVVYAGVLSGQLKSVKLFSLGTSLMGLALQPVLLQKWAEVALAANIAMFSMVGFFTYATPLLIHSITKKYVTELIYDPQKDTYTSITYNFFLRRIETVFKMDNVTVPDVPGPFTTFLVKRAQGKPMPLFVAPESFVYPGHYGRIMGYDKPIDLHLTKTIDKKD